MIISHLYCLICWLATLIYAKPLIDREIASELIDYLRRFRYIEEEELNRITQDKLVERTRQLSLELIGSDSLNYAESDQLTNEIRKPRCPMKDETIIEQNKKRRRKRYVSNNSKWHFTNLTWKFHDPRRLFAKPHHFHLARQVIWDAFNLWSGASDGVLTFTELPSNSNETADIDVYFARGNHDDFEAFDGKGGIVAHSGYPMDGQVHFDASEVWSTTGKRGVDLRYVSTHELGHALGLRHSTDKRAIMHPVYKKEEALALSEDDVLGIRRLYKAKVDKDAAIRMAKMRYKQRMRRRHFG